MLKFVGSCTYRDGISNSNAYMQYPYAIKDLLHDNFSE